MLRKKIMSGAAAWAACGLLVSQAVADEPVKVLLAGFEDGSGAPLTGQAVEALSTEALAENGVYAMTDALLDQEGIRLVDRGDYIRQVRELKNSDLGRDTPVQPTLLNVAQNLNADAVVKGRILSFASSGQAVRQAGYEADFTVLTMRAAIQVQDALDGSVIAMGQGTAKREIRQTGALTTTIGETGAFEMLEEAIAKAADGIGERIRAVLADREDRPTVRVAIATSDDPALVEIDGVLVGTTPIESLRVAEGDRVLTVSKPGHRRMTKRIDFREDVRLEIPMLRIELSAEEWKEMVDKVNLHIVEGSPAIVITPMD
jgi:hypothetical protein